MTTHNIYVSESRLEYIKKSGINYHVVATSDKGNISIDITIERDHDLMSLFHAGIEYGMDQIINATK